MSLEVGDWDGHQKRLLLIDHGLFEVIMIGSYLITIKRTRKFRFSNESWKITCEI